MSIYDQEPVLDLFKVSPEVARQQALEMTLASEQAMLRDVIAVSIDQGAAKDSPFNNIIAKAHLRVDETEAWLENGRRDQAMTLFAFSSLIAVQKHLRK